MNDPFGRQPIRLPSYMQQPKKLTRKKRPSKTSTKAKTPVTNIDNLNDEVTDIVTAMGQVGLTTSALQQVPNKKPDQSDNADQSLNTDQTLKDSDTSFLGDGVSNLPTPIAAKPKKRLRRRQTFDPLTKIAQVPDMSIYDTYVGRSIDGVPYTKVFDYAMDTASNVLVQGPTGAGKTMAARAYAALRNLPFYSLASSSASEPSQMFGKLLPDGQSFSWTDGPITDIVRNGGLLLINEVNFLPPRIATVLFGLLDGRRSLTLVDHKGEVIRAHVPFNCWCGGSMSDTTDDNFRPDPECVRRRILIIADMNPDYRGTQRLNEAFLNRFAIKLQWDYDKAVERELVLNGSLLDFAMKIRESPDAEAMAPVGTNKLIEFDQVVIGLQNLNFAKTNFWNSFDARHHSFLNTLWATFGQNIENEYVTKGFLAAKGR